MYAKYLALLAAFLGAALAEGSESTDGHYENLTCDSTSDAMYNITKSECTEALQASIPHNGYTTTQGGLHADYGGCTVTVASDNEKDILKGVLSKYGQQAIQETTCYDANNSSMITKGTASVSNWAGSAHFNLTWKSTGG